MLQKMGWAPGKGLGANEDGRTKHLTHAKRDEKIGRHSLACYSEW